MPEYTTVDWRSRRVDANLIAFREYFIGQVSGYPNRDKSLLWNHFDMDGPRTTNNAEGLRSAFDSRTRAPLNVFLGNMLSSYTMRSALE